MCYYRRARQGIHLYLKPAVAGKQRRHGEGMKKTQRNMENEEKFALLGVSIDDLLTDLVFLVFLHIIANPPASSHSLTLRFLPSISPSLQPIRPNGAVA